MNRMLTCEEASRRFFSYLDRALSGAAGQFETTMLHKSGERRHLTVNYACPQRSREVICMIRDATAEKQLQQQLIQMDAVFKVLNLLGTTHPFHTLRAAELRDWVEAGDYDRILRGEYHRRGEPRTAYMDDLRAASQSYREDAKEVFDQMAEGARDAARKVREAFSDAFRPR